MTIHAIVVDVLLAVAVAVALASCIGVAVMRDPFQRLHFISPPATVSIALFSIAAFLDEKDASAAGKTLLIGLFLTMVNAVVTHATARALRIRQNGEWKPLENERIERVGGGHVGGEEHPIPQPRRLPPHQPEAGS